MMGGDFGWGGGWMFFGGLMMLLFWGGLFVLIVWAIRAVIGGNTANRSSEMTISQNKNVQSPLEVLQARYAKGEISREDYDVIRRDLQTN